MKGKWMKIVRQYTIITLGISMMAVGVYFFKFPNNFSIYNHLSLIWVDQAADSFNQHCFSGAISPNDSMNFPLLKRDIDLPEYGGSFKGLCNILYFNNRFHKIPPITCFVDLLPGYADSASI